MAATITWLDETSTATCPVCTDGGIMRLVAEAVGGGREPIAISRCGRCGSLHLTGQVIHLEPADDSVDEYLEAGAGIGAIAAMVHRVETSDVRRFLDVGCNYGFALDIGRFLYGWEIQGVEPSYPGRRGAVELELPILHEFLDENTDVGDPYDLILASEVVEHVPDPSGFLSTLRDRLTPDGALVLTTPAAELLEPDVDPEHAVLGLSPGHHVFLLSETGLRTLLARAGFTHISVHREGLTLYGLATMSEQTFERAEASPPVSQLDLERYFDYRAGATTVPALKLGMAARHLRGLVARGDFAPVPQSRARYRDALLERTGLDIDAPLDVEWAVRVGTTPPLSLAGVAYALGILELLTPAGTPQRAGEYFQLALTAIDRRERLDLLDGEHLHLRVHARAHRSLVLAGSAPADAVAEFAKLAADPGVDHILEGRLGAWRARIFVTLVAGDHLAEAEQLAAEVGATADALSSARNAESRVAGLDALYSLGILALNTGDPDTARRWFTLCAHRASLRPADDAHAAGLRSVAEELAATAAERGGADPGPIEPPLDDPQVHHRLEVYWCDAYGVHVAGWAHAEDDPVEMITVRVGNRTASQRPDRRDDVGALWPHFPHAGDCGYELHVTGTPAATVDVELTTASGMRRVRVELPAHPLPEPPNPAEQARAKDEAWERARLETPMGPVLTVGLRDVDTAESEKFARDFAPRKVINLDIHPGAGIHVVGDAHQLSRFFRHGSFAAVASGSVLEHLTAPWLFAAEVNRVLMMGGMTFQTAPFAWPEHSMPNDFWRFTPSGLAQLFGPLLGFEVLNTGSTGNASIVPSLDWRHGHLRMPTIVAPGTSWILARKVRDIEPGAVAWPLHGEAVARAYPVEALARWTPQP